MRILLLVHSYPLVPQTFTQAEVLAWGAEGLDVRVLAFRRPPPEKGALLSAQSRAEQDRTAYLGAIRWQTWVRGIGVFARRPVHATGTLLSVATARYASEDSLRLRIHSLLTWFRAIGAAGVLKEGAYDHVHAEFADDAATVAWVLHRITGVPFSFRDHLSYNPQLVLAKVRSAAVVLACCDASRRLLLERAGLPASDRVLTSYLGVDVCEWASSPRDGEGIMCVGTLQEKKGQVELLRACAELRDRGLVPRCTLVGDGPLRSPIEAEIHRLGLGPQVTITGYVSPDRVRRLIQDAAIMCLPSVVTHAGDSDGIPVALMEAMALGRACVSTDAGGIAELITSGVDGILVPQRDVTALADALERCLKDRELRRRLGGAARRTIEERFCLDVNARESARAISRGAADLSASALG